MTTRPPSPWDKAAIRTADTRRQDNASRRVESYPRQERAVAPRRENSNRQELRYYGLNAVQAVFAQRPEAIRKLYLAESRIPQMQPLLAWCVQNRIGYRVVEEADLGKLAASSHHEGVVADVLRVEPLSLSAWLESLPPGPVLALWLDGVGNPHNFGAILQSQESTLAVSGAAARVAEGGAENVPLVRMGEHEAALSQLRGAGFQLGATIVSGGEDLFATPLPQRLVYVMGAEGEGMDPQLAAACDLRLSIPGSGAVESLNVAAATAVFLAEWQRDRG